jgi:hypothetical protein
MATREPQITARELAHSSWVDRSARLGLVAKGIAYVIVAVIAIQVAVGAGGQPQGPDGALEAVADEPFGWGLLVLLAVGFVGYAVWRVAQALFDREHEGRDPIGLGKRLGYVADGLLHLGLGALAIAVLAGSGGSGSGEEQQATALALDKPFGRWLVGAVGVGIVVLGLGFAIWACTGRFRDNLRTGMMREAETRGYTALGIFGHVARAVVVVLVGVFVVRAAWQYDANEAVGLDGALQRLAGQPYGPYLLGTVAFGLLAYGFFCFVEARYRDV